MSLKIEPSGAGAAGSAAAAELRELRSSLPGQSALVPRDLRTDMRIGGESGIGAGGASKVDEVHEAGGFAAILEKTAMAASAKEHEAVGKAEALAQGRIDDLHGTMITMKEADISLKLVGSVRDKLMDAFHELWRINV